MKTIIDQCYDVSLERMGYFNEGELKIILIELKRLKEPQDVIIGDVTLKNNYLVEHTEDSRHFLVKFEKAIFSQVLDEFYVMLDKDEIRDTDEIIQIISNSKYQQYINENFGWYKDVVGEERVLYFVEQRGDKGFSRKDYMKMFPKLSTATASRDLQKAVEKSIVSKIGEKRLTRYQKRK